MGILGLDLDKINLDDENNFYEDDPETIIQVRLSAWRNKFEKRKALKKDRWRINACSMASYKMVGWVLARKWGKWSGANSYWEVLKILLVRVGSIWSGGIVTFWDRKLYMKTWYNSKNFMNFTNFSCLIFLTEIVLIPPKHILLKRFYNYKFLLEYKKAEYNFLLYNSSKCPKC